MDRQPAPAASVLMAVYNERPDMLETAMRSVLSQSFADFEFVIVDDGSTQPETLTMLDRFCSEDSRVRVLKQPHRGVTKATNHGLAQCRGEFVFRHDSDDWSEPERFAKQLSYLRSHPDIALVGSRTMTHQEDGTPLWVWMFPTEPEDISASMPVRNPFCNGSVCFRREAMESIGGYREELAYSLDYDCYWRMSDRYRVANLPDVLYHYRFARKSISTSRAQEQKRCAVIAQILGRMRRNGGREDFAAASAEADAWMKRNRSFDLLQHADHTMLAGAHREALSIYSRLLVLRPYSLRVWMKVFRFFIFVAIPPMRKTMFNADFVIPRQRV